MALGAETIRRAYNPVSDVEGQESLIVKKVVTPGNGSYRLANTSYHPWGVAGLEDAEDIHSNGDNPRIGIHLAKTTKTNRF